MKRYVPKKAAKPAAPKPTKPARAKKPAAPPAPPPVDAKPHKEPEDKREPMSGDWLHVALKYLLKACPKDGGMMAWTTDAQGCPVISAHNEVISLTVFIPKDVHCDFRGGVSWKTMKGLASLLSGIRSQGVAVRIDDAGHVVMSYGVGQPNVTYKLARGDVPIGWKPPAPPDLSSVPLRLPLGLLKAAQNWPKASALITQHTDCTGRIELQGPGGVVYARAVLVEEGATLYPANPAQTEVKGLESKSVLAQAAAKAAAEPMPAKPETLPAPAAEAAQEALQAAADQVGAALHFSDGNGKHLATIEPSPRPREDLTGPATLPQKQVAAERPANLQCLWILGSEWDHLTASEQESLERPARGLELVWHPATAGSVVWRTTECRLGAVDRVVRAALALPRHVQVYTGDEPPRDVQPDPRPWRMTLTAEDFDGLAEDDRKALQWPLTDGPELAWEAGDDGYTALVPDGPVYDTLAILSDRWGVNLRAERVEEQTAESAQA